MLQPKLTKVEPVKPLKLCLYYETGEVKLFDAAPYATGSWYGRLQDERYFATVHLLPGGIGIEWEEGQDIAPHELYENSVPVKKTATQCKRPLRSHAAAFPFDGEYSAAVYWMPVTG